MIAGGNVVGKWSEKKMEGDDGLRTVECLRGRLLAERVASRVAKQDADQMSTKLIELETQLRIEMKSRNKAEKRLKFLMKKLESLNISYVSDESENSSLLENSEFSSVSSTASSYTKNPEDKEPNTQTQCDIREPMKKKESSIFSGNLKHNVSETTTSEQSQSSSSNEENLGFTEKSISEKSDEVESSPNFNDSKTDVPSLKSAVEDKAINRENDQDWDDSVDNSLALVPVDLPIPEKTIDPPATNASVKDVLDALRHARENLQSSMERRYMIKVGSR